MKYRESVESEDGSSVQRMQEQHGNTCHNCGQQNKSGAENCSKCRKPLGQS